jgi:hypothetical protein
MRVFEKRVVRIFGPKMEEVTSGCIKTCNEDLQNAYFRPNIIISKLRRMKWP